MDLKKIKKHHLVAFIQIVEQKGIRAASRTMAISQPSLSRTMKELEMLTGLSLLTRASDGAVLTDAGRNFLVHARHILRGFEELEDDILSLHNQQSDHLSIGLGGSLNMFLPGVINHIIGRYPDITLTICEEQTDVLMQKLRNRELDFCITTIPSRGSDPKFHVEKLLELRFGIFASKLHPLRHATKVQALHNQSWIMPPVRTGYHSLMMDFLVASHLSPLIPVQTNNIFSVPSILERTELLSILPVSFIQTSGFQDRLVELNIDFLLPLATYHLAWRKNEPLSASSLQVISCMKAQIADMPVNTGRR